jgi:hypothetical protein
MISVVWPMPVPRSGFVWVNSNGSRLVGRQTRHHERELADFIDGNLLGFDWFPRSLVSRVSGNTENWSFVICDWLFVIFLSVNFPRDGNAFTIYSLFIHRIFTWREWPKVHNFNERRRSRRRGFGSSRR